MKRKLLKQVCGQSFLFKGGFMVRIESEDKNSFISFIYVECEEGRCPSVCFSLEIQNEDFKGYNKSIWIEFDMLKKFVDELISLELHRKGNAKLEAMSPNEFNLQIERIDMSGHLNLTYNIARQTYSRKPYLLALSGGFELESSLFSAIVRDFKDLYIFNFE